MGAICELKSRVEPQGLGWWGGLIQHIDGRLAGRRGIAGPLGLPDLPVPRGPFGPLGLGVGIPLLEALAIGLGLLHIGLILPFDPGTGGSDLGGALGFTGVPLGPKVPHSIFTPLGLQLGGWIVAAPIAETGQQRGHEEAREGLSMGWHHGPFTLSANVG